MFQVHGFKVAVNSNHQRKSHGHLGGGHGHDKEDEFFRTLDPEEQGRLEAYDEKDKRWQNEKAEWKRKNPEDTIKRHKELYIKGFIEKLPWEDISLEKPEDLESWNKWVDAANKEAEKEDEGVEKKRLTNLQ